MIQNNVLNQRIGPVEIDVTTAICLIAQLQLATRHPENIGPSRQVAEAFARVLQQQVVEVAPEAAAILEMGWNPDFDIE